MDVTNYSSSSAPSVQPDVFLSFRGADTCRDFADPLYTGLTNVGISVYRDKKRVGAEKDIDPTLVEAIEHSKISIPIISPEYTSSKSCLTVLAKMLECRDTMNHAIIPIFYAVNSSNNGSSADSKRRKVDTMLADPWKSVLHRIEQLEGYRLDQRSDVLLSEIVLYVTRQLKKAELVGTSMPVGIENQVHEMMVKLDVDYHNGQAVEIRGNEVRMVIIHGFEGIGKTTLAKFVYNKVYPLFEGCSYLGNIQEILRTDPLEHLQSQLVSDLLKQEPITFRSLEEGIYHIRHRFRNMRVLIVLDDVNEQDHLDAFAGKQSWFGSRSRIIVTTRNADLLNISKEAVIYNFVPMDFLESLHLFCLHAFGASSPRENYSDLSRHIVSTIRGLPIAIEVVGSFLYRKNIRIWNETLQKLKKEKEPVNSVRQVLMTSYEDLDQKTKDIFLDIACFFIGKDKRIPSYMWEDYGLNPCSGIESLLLMSLVKIDENNELSVCDLLRDLGRTIVHREDPMNPSKRSRLWNHEDARNALKRKERMKEVEALCLKFESGSHKCFTSKDSQSLSKLRFLKLDNANLKGDFANLLSNLRWLDWRGCPLTFQAKNLDLKKLVILDLSWSKVSQNWGGWSRIEMPRLKVLNLTGCNEMLITPEFFGYEQLEMLILENCYQLVMIDPSICHLRLLVSLNLKSCRNLGALPEGIGDMKSLKELLIDGTSLQEIPESIARMKKLEILSASKCHSLTKLPESICLEALLMLLLDNAKILELPDSIGRLVKLQRLSLRDCEEMRKLPVSIGELGCSMVELDISGTLISELPDSMRNLQLLRVLKMERCHVRKFPSAICMLRKLEEIHASHCRSLKGRIPSKIENLQFLKILILGYSCVSSLPPSIQSLSHLQTLDLLACDNLETLPMLPSSLICLSISSKKMSIIPDIQNLVELEDLTFGDENPKELMVPPSELDPSILTEQLPHWPVRFLKLKSFEFSHSRIHNLGFECVPQLKKVVLTGGNLQGISGLPSSLSILSIQACLSLKSLPTVRKLDSLLELELSNSAVKEIKGLGGLTSLEILVVSRCHRILHLDGLSNLISLKRLSLKNCKTLANLPSVSNLTMLKFLEIHRCRKIHDIEGLEKLTSLEELHVSECEAERSPRVTDAQERISRRWSGSP